MAIIVQCIKQLYDFVILNLCGEQLVTSDMHKPFPSTDLCTAVLKEIIDIYKREDNVYCDSSR